MPSWTVQARHIAFPTFAVTNYKICDANALRSSLIIQNRSPVNILILQFDTPRPVAEGLFLDPLQSYEIDSSNPFYGEVWAYGLGTSSDWATEYTWTYK